MAGLIIRRAKVEDRERVLEFTHDTFQWGDYIHRVFDRWLADKSGRLLVAELDNEILGLSFVKLTKKGEVWLQGGRVETRHRRKGIGGAMIDECLRIAKEEMNASAARVITDKINLPPQKLLSKLGFNIVTQFTELEKIAERIKDPLLIRHARIAERELVPDMWQYLRRSPLFKKSGGLYTIWFVWYTLEEEDLTRFTQEGKALVYAPGGMVHGVMLTDDSTTESKNEKSIQTCYFDADNNVAVKALSGFLSDYAAKSGLEKIRLWTFPDEMIIESLRETGFVGEVEESTEMVWMKRL